MVKPQIYPPLDKLITQTASELHLSAVYFCRPNCAAHLCILFQLYPPFFPSFPTLLSHSSSIGSHKTGGSPLHLVGDTDLPPTTASSKRLAVIPLWCGKSKQRRPNSKKAHHVGCTQEHDRECAAFLFNIHRNCQCDVSEVSDHGARHIIHTTLIWRPKNQRDLHPIFKRISRFGLVTFLSSKWNLGRRVTALTLLERIQCWDDGHLQHLLFIFLSAVKLGLLQNVLVFQHQIIQIWF